VIRSLLQVQLNLKERNNNLWEIKGSAANGRAFFCQICF
jgi:hypothetical protein